MHRGKLAGYFLRNQVVVDKEPHRHTIPELMELSFGGMILEMKTLTV